MEVFVTSLKVNGVTTRIPPTRMRRLLRVVSNIFHAAAAHCCGGYHTTWHTLHYPGIWL
jgi:hypothetical protein